MPNTTRAPLRTAPWAVARLLCLGACVCPPTLSVCQAQSAAQENAATRAKDSAASEVAQAAKLRELEALSRELAPTQATDPVGAQGRYKEFFESGGYLYPLVVIRLSLLTGALHVQHNQRAQALTIYDWALQNYGAYPQSQELRRARAALMEGEQAPLASQAALPALNPVNITALGAVAVSGLEGVKIGLAPGGALAKVEAIGPVTVGSATVGALATLEAIGPVTVGSLASNLGAATPVTVGAGTATAPGLWPMKVEAASPVPVGALGALRTVAPLSAVAAVASATGSAPVVAPAAVPTMARPSVLEPMTRIAALPFPSIASVNGVEAKGVSSVAALGAVETGAPLSVPALTGIAPQAAAQTLAPQAAVGGAALGREALVLQGAVDARELWQSGQLSLASVVALLEQPPLSAPTPAQVGARGVLLSLLVEHGETLWMSGEAKSGLTARLRAEVGDALIERQDRRGIALWQQLVEEAQGQEKASRLYRLSAAHAGLGELGKAGADLEAAVPLLSKAQPQWAASTLIEAARLYDQAQQTNKANALYARVSKYGDGWLSGMVIYDQADVLMKQGQYEAERRLLKTPVTGPGAEEIKVALLSKLGYSYYRTGEWELAKKYCNATIAGAQAVELRPDVGLQQRVIQAREVLRLIAHWQNRPLICEPPQLAVCLDQQATAKPLAVFFTVRTFDEVPLVVSCDDARFTARVASKGVAGDAADYHFVGRDVLVQIAPQALSQNFETTLLVKSPLFPAFEERVKICVEVKR